MLRAGEWEDAVNFNEGIETIAPCRIVQSATHQKDKVFDAHVISNGDPLEIYTDKEGGVIFKKYSILGGLTDFSAQVCESMNKTTGGVAVVTDRDTCISAAGCPRRELADRRVSAQLEELMEGRRLYQYTGEGKRLPVCEDSEKYAVAAAAPILSEGDVLGCVLFASSAEKPNVSETEFKLVQTIAGFLGRHMEC
ncbi:MAG: stage V sporulation protein T [Oscillospiraceae bacterium]|nr:stage V sporulation protein T [Oscillospiraceae bacterium]